MNTYLENRAKELDKLARHWYIQPTINVSDNSDNPNNKSTQY